MVVAADVIVVEVVVTDGVFMVVVDLISGSTDTYVVVIVGGEGVVDVSGEDAVAIVELAVVAVSVEGEVTIVVLGVDTVVDGAIVVVPQAK